MTEIVHIQSTRRFGKAEIMRQVLAWMAINVYKHRLEQVANTLIRTTGAPRVLAEITAQYEVEPPVLHDIDHLCQWLNTPRREKRGCCPYVFKWEHLRFNDNLPDWQPTPPRNILKRSYDASITGLDVD